MERAIQNVFVCRSSSTSFSFFPDKDFLRHHGRVLLIAQGQIRRTHLYTFVTDRVIHPVILFQIEISFPIIPYFFVVLLQIFVAYMYHIRINVRRSNASRQYTLRLG